MSMSRNRWDPTPFASASDAEMPFGGHEGVGAGIELVRGRGGSAGPLNQLAARETEARPQGAHGVGGEDCRSIAAVTRRAAVAEQEPRVMPEESALWRVQRLSPQQYRCSVVILNEMGLHARPASLLVKVASGFQSELSIERDGQSFDGRSILQLLSLCAETGVRLTLETRGEDAKEALEAVVDLVSRGFDEVEPAGNPRPR